MNTEPKSSDLPTPLKLPYQPQVPKGPTPGIGLIGCGGIAGDHLTAYRDAGWSVVALCDIDRNKAEQRKVEFFPEAALYTDYHDLLRDERVEIVDIALHTHLRPPIIATAIESRRHVLSQKPFVDDLDVGQQLVDLAHRHGVTLAVNQNGRWAPHFSYMRQAVSRGLLGHLMSVNMSIHWDHTWVKGTAFESMQQLVLYDYAIHWFDMVNALLLDQSPKCVFATRKTTATQTIKPPLLASVIVEAEHATAVLSFVAQTPCLQQDRTYLAGSKGSIVSWGPDEKNQTLQIETELGKYQPQLVGHWFPDAFRGTMGELLCSLEENRPCQLAAENNLKSLELCFAAVASSMNGEPIQIGQVRKLRPEWL
jgi:predicted dehydrogenase